MVEDKAVGMVRRYSFAQLLEGPGGGWMRGHVEVNNSARGVFHDHQHVKQPESRARDGAEIASDDGRRVILQKGGPALIVAPVATAWRGGRLWQVFPDRARRDAQAELQQQFVRNALLVYCRLSLQRSGELGASARIHLGRATP